MSIRSPWFAIMITVPCVCEKKKGILLHVQCHNFSGYFKEILDRTTSSKSESAIDESVDPCLETAI